MVSHAIKDELLSRLERLPVDLQRRVLAFADALSRTEVQGTPGSVMRSLAGMLDEQSAREMSEAIEEGCEQVDEGRR